MVCISKTDVRRVTLNSISTPCGRKTLHMQLLDLSSNYRFHAKYGIFENQPYLENGSPLNENKLYFNPLWVEREYMCNLWTFRRQA